MAIPNSEVRYIYKTTVLRWFEEQVKQKDLSILYCGLSSFDSEIVEKELTERLRESISFYDNKESFYHGFMLGLLGGREEYLLKSNREAGDGRYDISMRSLDVKKPVIIVELKLAASYYEMEQKSDEALQQIFEKNYKEAFAKEGHQIANCFGISFYKKNCRVKGAENFGSDEGNRFDLKKYW